MKSPVLRVLSCVLMAAFFPIVSAFSQPSYQIGPRTDLLDSNFYTGTAGGRGAYWGTMSNAGDRIAFYGVDYTSGFTTEMYIVTPGDPSSWVKLTTGFPEIPNRLISWTPDDSGFYAGPYFTNATTGAVTTPTVFGYNPDDSSLTTLPADNWLVTQVVSSIVGEQVEVDYIRVVGTPYLYEFNTDGDTEGWQATAGYSSLVVAGGTMTGDVSTNDPILSSVTFGAPIDASVTNTVSIRMRPSVRAFGELYWITSADPAENSSKRVRFDSGPAGSFNDITIDLSTHPNWTGNVTDLRIDLVSSTRDLVALPILANGQEDTGRSPVAITNIDGPDLVGNVDWQVIAPDGSALAFVDYAGSQVAGVADHADVYLIEDLQDILSGSQPAVTSLADPRVKGIRVGESPNFAHTPTISQDGSLVLYGEDFNNLFRNDDFFATLQMADLSIMVSNSDGTGSDFQIVEPNSQAVPTSTRGGTRILFTATQLSPLDFHLFISTLEVSTPVSGTTVGNPVDNDIVTTVDQVAEDGSGTVLEIPSGTTIDFPVGAPQEIVVETPIDPVTPVQLPPDVDAIPVVREFGPSGTQFSPAITVTITYTDAEIVGLDEANLELYLYNTVSGIFDIPVVVTARDLVNNTLSFETDHFSTFGIAGKNMADSDNDGLTDDDETNVHNTNPSVPDTDGDGLYDGWEVTYLLDPLDDGSVNPVNGPDDDSDGDGYTNLQEFLRGGNPYVFENALLPAAGLAGIFVTLGAICAVMIRLQRRRSVAS